MPTRSSFSAWATMSSRSPCPLGARLDTRERPRAMPRSAPAAPSLVCRKAPPPRSNESPAPPAPAPRPFLLPAPAPRAPQNFLSSNPPACSIQSPQAKIFQVRKIRVRRRMKQFSGGRPLQRERRGLLRNIFDTYVQRQCVLPEPPQARVRGGPAIFVFPQPRDRSVVDHFPFGVAPTAVNHLIHGHFIDVARNHAIHELCGVAPGHAVFEQRRNIDQRRRIPDGVVLVLVVHLVHADRVIARPLAVVQAFAQRQCSLMKRGSNRHDPS